MHTHIFITIQNMLPSFAAIDRAIDAAFFIWTMGMSEGRDVDEIGVLRMDTNLADVACIFQAYVRPGLATIGRFIDTVTMSHVAANCCLARPNVEDVGVGRRNGYGTN